MPDLPDRPCSARAVLTTLIGLALVLLGLAQGQTASAEPPGVPVTPGGSLLRTAGDPSLDRLVFPALPVGVTYTAVEAGAAHSLALRSDGKVDTAGYDFWGQRDLPVPFGDRYTAIAAGGEHTLALVSDGSVVAVGRNVEGQATIPAPGGGTSYTAIAAGGFHSLVLRSDGTAQGYGLDADGQASPPALPLGLTYTALAAGDHHSLALRSDGQVVAFGANGSGQTVVPLMPPGRYAAISAGDAWSLALTTDGHLVAWGADVFGVVTDLPQPPPGTRFTAISAGGQFGIALRSDGVVVHWGKDDIGQGALPAPPAGSRYVAIGAGGAHSLGVVRIDPPTQAAPTLTLKAKPKRDRSAPYKYRLKGRVTGSFTPGPDVCGGTVDLVVKQGKRVVVRRSAPVDAHCRVTTKVKVKGAKVRGRGQAILKVRASYSGHVSPTTVLQQARTGIKVRAR